MIITGYWDTREVTVDGERLLPGSSQKLRNHSPDGFAWGYLGSGPAQLALALLLTSLSQQEAISLYQEFKQDVIARLPEADFTIDINIKAWANTVNQRERERER